ncbi:MAG: YiiX/YebB-like N1pC/P60 family cysteine hydrolase [Vicingaceae bacterium]|nr:YiiX/YebB-like N1pC/P60 family cysteine hydrolase [Vicingaceae bacterium]
MRLKKRYFPHYIITLVVMIIVVGYFASQTKKEKQKEICWANIESKITTVNDLDSLLKYELSEFQMLVEQSLMVRAEMIKVANEISQDTEGPIQSKHLEFLKENTQMCLTLRDELYAVTNRYECALDATEEDLTKEQIPEVIRTKAVMLSTAAALTLYDNYLLGALMFENDKRLRRLVNDPDKGFGISENELLEITLSANSISKQQRIQDGIQFFENKAELFRELKDYDYYYLKLLIYSSPSYNHFKNISTTDMLAKKFQMFTRISRDVVAEMRDDGFDEVSMFFGNSVGLVESRKGKLFGNEIIKKEIQDVLQPLDIILEKTPFRLTDKLIPGHFGHVAIWIGNQKELKEKGLWEHEVVIPYHNKISPDGSEESKNGFQIVEALREGVKLSSLEEFMNIDDIAILRPRFGDNVTEKEKESLLLAFRQLGKEYDFNFDVNTTEKIVCSELAYVCFPQIDWPTEKTAGRHTISPDNVANLCWKGIPLELITFYHDGKKCKEENQLAIMKELMEEK